MSVGDEVEVLLVREIRSLEFVSEEVSEAVSNRNASGRVKSEGGNVDEYLRGSFVSSLLQTLLVVRN